jgi:hypothetical protein
MKKKLTLFGLLFMAFLFFFITCTDNPVNNTTQQTNGISGNGYFTILYPEYNETDTAGNTLSIAWVSSGTISSTTYITLSLYNDTQKISTLASSTLNDGAYTTTIPTASSGTKYRIKINVYSDTAKYDYSAYFSITSQYNGSYTISNPTNASTWIANSTDTIKWITTGNPGIYSKLQLFKGSTAISTITTTVVTSNDKYIWTIPSAIVTGDDYRIRISSYYDDSIYSFSDLFSITGTTGDTFEYDGTITSASSIKKDDIQYHTITYGDTDWVSFIADSGIKYAAQYLGGSSFRSYISIYNGTSYLTQSYANSYGNMQYVFTPSQKDTYNFAVRSYTSGNSGTYSFRISKLDTTSQNLFTNPTSTSTFNAGSTYTVKWTPDSLLYGSYVYIYLYNGNTLVTTYSSANSGTCSILVPSGTFSGNNYMLKLISQSNTSIYGYSSTFSVAGLSPDSYENDNIRDSAKILTVNTVQSRNLTYNDTDWISIAADSGKNYVLYAGGTPIYAYLFYGTQTTNTKYFYNTSSSGIIKPIASNPWLCTQTGTYYFRITPYTSGTYGSYYFSVNQFDTNTAVTFTSPVSTSAWSAGSSNTITFSADTNIFSKYLYIYLYKGSTLVQTISSYATNLGTCTFTLASNLVTGSDYRIKIANYSNSYIFGYSPYFTINGLSPDLYESDDSATLAKSITVDGTYQSRTISMNDVDWVTFPAQKDSIYLIRFTGDSYAKSYIYLYSNSATSSLTYTYGISAKLVWTCPATGSYYLKILPYSSSYYGSYQLSVKEYSPSSIATFTNPTNATTWNAGSTYSIKWNADTALFGSYVSVAFTKDTASLLAIASSVSNNNSGGTYSWTIPTDKFGSDTNYRIRIRSTTNTTVNAYSPYFTISGIAPDTYEPDDTASLAHSIAADTIWESHTMPYLDKDWYAFTAQSGMLYYIKTNGAIHTGIQLYSSDKQTLLNTANTLYSDTNTSMLWSCTNSGTYYFLVTSSAYYGSYQTMLTQYDSTEYRYTLTQPSSADTLTAGTVKEILWSSLMTISGNVDIFLYNSSGIPSTIASNISNTGTYSWTVPSSLSAGPYYLKVSNVLNSNVYGISGTFTVITQ